VKVVDSATRPFERALAAIRVVDSRPEFILDEVPAPQRLAPHAYALTAESCEDSEAISGRFVLLHDPDGIDEWEGTFRVVIFMQVQPESDMVTDELMTDVAWSWLLEAIHPLDTRQLGGTVTKSLGQSFGTMADRQPQGIVEIRASWTPEDLDAPESVSSHFQAWLRLLELGAGLNPLPEGVATVHQRRRG
jgi:hypothetical protein